MMVSESSDLSVMKLELVSCREHGRSPLGNVLVDDGNS